MRCREIGAQVLDAVNLRDLHDDRLHAIDRCKRRFDFTDFDAQTTQLDLIVGTPENLDRAVRHPARVIARTVQAFSLALDEYLSGFFRKLVIPKSYARTTYEELADNTCRQLVVISIDDAFPYVVERMSDRYGIRVREVGHVRRHGRLSRPIRVDDACICRPLQQRKQALRVFLATR